MQREKLAESFQYFIQGLGLGVYIVQEYCQRALNVAWMLRRYPNIQATLSERLVFVGIFVKLWKRVSPLHNWQKIMKKDVEKLCHVFTSAFFPDLLPVKNVQRLHWLTLWYYIYFVKMLNQIQFDRGINVRDMHYCL